MLPLSACDTPPPWNHHTPGLTPAVTLVHARQQANGYCSQSVVQHRAVMSRARATRHSQMPPRPFTLFTILKVAILSGKGKIVPGQKRRRLVIALIYLTDIATRPYCASVAHNLAAGPAGPHATMFQVRLVPA